MLLLLMIVCVFNFRGYVQLVSDWCPSGVSKKQPSRYEAFKLAILCFALAGGARKFNQGRITPVSVAFSQQYHTIRTFSHISGVQKRTLRLKLAVCRYIEASYRSRAHRHQLVFNVIFSKVPYFDMKDIKKGNTVSE